MGAAVIIHHHHVDGDVVFESAELFEAFHLFEGGRGESQILFECREAIAVDADVAVDRRALEPLSPAKKGDEPL